MRKPAGVLALAPLAFLFAGAPSPRASLPSPPSGYSETYSHNFTTQGMGDWVTQPGAGATVSVSKSDGLGVGVTGIDQWAEVISSDAVIGPDSFVQAYLYVPPGPGGLIANWSGLWTSGNPWPQNGEIDILESQGGYACLETHYGTSGSEISSPSHCAPAGLTGWHTVSMLRSGEQVTAWYDSTEMGTVPLPVTAGEELIFQNQDGPDDSCAPCNGPLVYPSTAWLKSVTVWNASTRHHR
jgi:hypothetical protein